MAVILHDQTFDPWNELANFQASQPQLKDKFGATAVFVGTMRDFNQNDNVSSMYLEHYPGMTEKSLQAIEAQSREQWPLLEVLIVHRIGEIKPNDSIVLVAVWSAHRHEAYEANRYIMEALKCRAPFWKKENLGKSMRWVSENSKG